MLTKRFLICKKLSESLWLEDHLCACIKTRSDGHRDRHHTRGFLPSGQQERSDDPSARNGAAGQDEGAHPERLGEVGGREAGSGGAGPGRALGRRGCARGEAAGRVREADGLLPTEGRNKLSTDSATRI